MSKAVLAIPALVRALSTGKHAGIDFAFTGDKITRQAFDFKDGTVTLSTVDGPQDDGQCELVDALRLDDNAELVVARLQCADTAGDKLDLDQSKWNMVGSACQPMLKKCRQFATGAVADLDRDLNGRWMTVVLKKAGASWEAFDLGTNCVQWTGRDNQYALLMDGYLTFLGREKFVGAISDKTRLRELARQSDLFMGVNAYLLRPPAGFAAMVRAAGNTFVVGFDRKKFDLPSLSDDLMFFSQIDPKGTPILGEIILAGGQGDQWTFKRGKRTDFPEYEATARIF